jgi:hypothetical protein
VVAVDPEQRDGELPPRRDYFRREIHEADLFDDAGPPEVLEEDAPVGGADQLWRLTHRTR